MMKFQAEPQAATTGLFNHREVKEQVIATRSGIIQSIQYFREHAAGILFVNAWDLDISMELVGKSTKGAEKWCCLVHVGQLL